MKPQHKFWIIEKLENWKETLNNNYPNYLEETAEERGTYYSIQALIKNYSNNNCSKAEYENILFHLWQAQHDL